MSNPESRPLNFIELRANVTTGIWDQARLAAIFVTSRVAGMVHEVFIDWPNAMRRGDDPSSYFMDKARRGTERLQEIGSWAVEQEIVGPDAKAPLPKYQKYF